MKEYGKMPIQVHPSDLDASGFVKTKDQQMKTRRTEIEILLKQQKKTIFFPLVNIVEVCINPQGRNDWKLKPEPHSYKQVQRMCYRYIKQARLLGIGVKQCVVVFVCCWFFSSLSLSLNNSLKHIWLENFLNCSWMKTPRIPNFLDPS